MMCPFAMHPTRIRNTLCFMRTATADRYGAFFEDLDDLVTEILRLPGVQLGAATYFPDSQRIVHKFFNERVI